MSQNQDEKTRINHGEFEQIKSAIPEHLIADSTPAEKHIVSSVSILEQRTNLLHQNDKILDQAISVLEGDCEALDGRVGDLEETQKKFKWGWKGVTLVFVVASAVLTAAMKAASFLGGLLK